MEYFWGPDTYAAREAIEVVARKAKANIRWADRPQLEAAGIADLAGQQVGLFGQSLLVVRDPSAFPKALQEDVAAYLEKEKKSQDWILWDRVAPDKRSKLWRAVKEVAREFPPTTPPALSSWLQKRAKELGGTIEPAAADMLVVRAGPDRWRLENELKRLLVVKSNPSLTREGSGVGCINTALVEQEVARAETGEIFSLLADLGRGEAARVIRSVQALFAAGHSEFYVLSMLGYQFRTLLLIRAGLDQNQGAAAIAGAGKLHPYVVEKNMPVAKRLPYAGWRDGLTRILATDFAIKQGRVEARTGLLMLLLTLSQSMQTAKAEV